MDSWKALGVALLTAISLQGLAEEHNNPFDKALFYTTIAPTVLIIGTTGLTTLAPEMFKSAKSDALAYIGSEGEIRGAQFEQAVHHYRATSRPPLMSDAQLALAIATHF